MPSQSASQRNTRDGLTVFPYRNTDGEHPSSIREWLDGRGRGRAGDLEVVRDEDTPRSRAIFALARLDAEYSGMHWDSIPWRDDDLGSLCQAWYVMGAITRIDYLLHAGAVELP